MRKVIIPITLSLIALLIVAVPVIAATYSATFTVSETSGTAYPMLPVIKGSPNQWMATNGFMKLTALDTRVETLGGSVKPHMVTDNRTLTAIPVPLNSQTNLYFTTGNSDLVTMNIIAGYGGYVSRADSPNLELLNNGSVSLTNIYVDTTKNTTLFTKTDSITCNTTSTGNIKVLVKMFPYISANTSGSGSSVNFTYTLPLSIGTGDLMILLCHNYIATGAAVVTPSAGWNALFNDTFNLGTNRYAAWYKTVAGGEIGNMFTFSGSAAYSWQLMLIPSGFWSGIPSYGVLASGAGANPNPPNLVSGFGAVPQLYIACFGNQASGADSITAVPANYSASQSVFRAVSGTSFSTRGYASASDNPGTFTVAPACQWGAETISVNSNSSSLIINQAVSSGDKSNVTFSVNITSGDFELWVNGSKLDSYTMSNGIVNNTNSYKFLDSVPYCSSLSITVNGTRQLYYAPNTMILGNTLPDREATGGTQDGTIVWGSNPVGVSVTLGSLMGEESSPSFVDDPDTQDVLPGAKSSDWYKEPDVSGSLLTNPFRPFVLILSDTTTLTERQAWVLLGIAFVLLVLVITAKTVRGHHIITGIATGAAIGLCVVQTIFPFYSIIFIIASIFVGAVAERSQSL